MLKEYALIYDIFDEACYSRLGTCDVHLSYIKDALLHDGIVRNLYCGQWVTKALENTYRFHPKAKELLKKIKKQNRLALFKPLASSCPGNDEEWILEALQSNSELALDGIITNFALGNKYNHATVSSIENIGTALWWQNRSSSSRLGRQTVNYLNHLRLILQHSNSLMFIDPHIDPSKHKYKEFFQILKTCKRGDGVDPLIEIHKVCYEGSGANRFFPSLEEWEERFKTAWENDLRNISLNAEVFIWDDFHDRYLISNLIGISCPNGFDTTTDQNDITTWTKLSKTDKDDVQREFDPASNKHQLKHKFKVF